MEFKELEELYKDETYQALPDIDESLSNREKAEVMVDTLTPKQLAKMALSKPKSLHHTPKGNELSVTETLRDYFYKQLLE